MKDKGFAVSTVLTLVWVSLWIIAYDNIWLKIPLVADLFPLSLPNGNLSYADFVTSVGIIGTLILASFVGYYMMKSGKETARGFHIN